MILAPFDEWLIIERFRNQLEQAYPWLRESQGRLIFGVAAQSRSKAYNLIMRQAFLEVSLKLSRNKL